MMLGQRPSGGIQVARAIVGPPAFETSWQNWTGNEWTSRFISPDPEPTSTATAASGARL
jgi:hypothetical protein